MVDLKKISDGLRDRRVDYVSMETGIHPGTIRGIRNGTNTNPKYETLTKLSAYLGLK
jgi:hypothetical protein